MPYKIKSAGKGKVKVVGPGGSVRAKSTTPSKAARQVRLLHGIENGWKPTGQKAQDLKSRVMAKY